ncbi:hypothetical protein SD70_07270 [Gordoniibacillus kamchatkensis]|uniref:HTH araC/xylS-type domain-containing protein n=1 Tax=Gordoniibacillus kamchatkensis TaxID=1590651 RepID=A0ABR5AK87_9BACL|nr:helix-turn-helix domain-containing protein [Paenibacillus sp. VKM B-2647]KIL41434.1 hypothetical protein SD70_07270 [Paenibacillus sp. VKM B-2647]
MFSLILSVIPVLFLGIFSYAKSSGMIQRKVNESNAQLLQQTQSRVEQELKAVDNMVIQYANTASVKSAIQKPLTPRDFLEVEDMLQSLRYMKTFEFGIENVFLVSSEQNWLIHNDGLKALAENEHGERLHSYLRDPRLSFWVYETVSGRPYISLVKKLPIAYGPTHGMIVVQIPVRYLQTMINLDRREHKTMIVDSSGSILTYDDSSAPGTDVSRPSYIQTAMKMNEGSGAFNATADKRSMRVIYRKSAYNEWMYVTAVSVDDITKDSRTIGWITFLTCLALFVAISAIAMFGSNKMYAPVRKLFQSVVGTAALKENKRRSDEFDFIQERIQSMLKTQKQLSVQVESQIQQLKIFFMQKLFRGEQAAHAAGEHLAEYRFPAEWRRLCVFALQIDTLSGTRYRKHDHDLLMIAVNNIMMELIPPERRYLPVPVDECQAILLCGKEEEEADFDSFVFQCAETVQRTVKDVLDLQVSIGISRPFRELRQTPKAFREGVEALKYRIRFGHGIILRIEDVLHGQTLRPLYPSRIASELCDAVRMADRETAVQRLHQFMQDIAAMDLSPRYYELFLSRLLTELLRLAEDSGPAMKALLAEERSLFGQMFAAKTMQEMEEWFAATVVEPIVDHFDKRNESQVKLLSDEIAAVIHRNYDTDLTLESCAALLHYHPSYIKRVFRKGKGVSFSDYLSMHRMAMARKWLVETDMKVSEIAERLRYNNSQNFIRHFRKVEGITPGEYRKRSELQVGAIVSDAGE